MTEISGRGRQKQIEKRASRQPPQNKKIKKVVDKIKKICYNNKVIRKQTI